MRIEQNHLSAAPSACDFQKFISDLSVAATNVR